MPLSDPTPPRLAPLARGATAAIFRSEDRAGEPAALKLSASKEANRAIEREAYMSGFLRHPALLPVLDSGTDAQGRAWLLLPLLPGTTLADWRGEDRELVEWLTPVADALDLLHHAGWGHADLKPANLLLAGERSEAPLLLSDLGLVSRLREKAPGGSPAYLSPSRIEDRPLTWRDDLHALAVLTYEALAGELPYGNVRGEALLGAIAKADILPLTRFREDLPADLDHLFATTLSDGTSASSVMGWMDELRARFGLDPAPRCLFLDDSLPASRQPGGDELLRERGRDSFRDLLADHLSSVTHERVPPGHDEASVLEDLAGGRRSRLLVILGFLLSRQLLRDDAGWASFHLPMSDWLGDLEKHFALVEQDETRATAAPSSTRGAEKTREEWLQAWASEAENAEARLRLLVEALSRGELDWLGAVSNREMLELAQRSSRESQLRLLGLADTLDLPDSIDCRITVLGVMRRLRDGEIEESEELFWRIEPDLNLETSGELNRQLLYPMLEEGKIKEGFRFLDEWRRRRGPEIEGSELEIRVAAREITALAKYGDPESAKNLASEFLDRFSGRRGLWIIYMALANLSSEKADFGEALRFSRLALEGIQEEGGSLDLEVGTLIYVADSIILAADTKSFPEISHDLDEAISKAEELNDPLLIERSISSKALWGIHRGDVAEAEELLHRAIRSAEQSGDLKRSPFFRINLAVAIYYQGDYRRLLPLVAELSAGLDEFDSLNRILYTKNILALFLIAFGRLDEARRHVEEALPIAVETGATKNEGYLLLKRAFLHHYCGETGEALADLEAARENFAAAKAEDEVWRCRLWRIELAPEPACDGDGLAELIESFERIEKPRYLPFTWRLLARHSRIAGDRVLAERALNAGLEVAGRLGNPEYLWPLHVEEAELAAVKKDRAAERDRLGRAVEILRDLSQHLPPGEERDRFLARSDRAAVLARLRGRRP